MLAAINSQLVKTSVIDGAAKGEQSRAAVKTPLRCVAVVSVLLLICCFATT
jgi:hypothetical protein